MLFEVHIVGFGEVGSEMNASTFLAHLRGFSYKQTNGEHILALPALGRIKDFVHYISLPELNNFLAFCKRLVASGDADISPHKSPK